MHIFPDEDHTHNHAPNARRVWNMEYWLGIHNTELKEQVILMNFGALDAEFLKFEFID